jgi:pimeloyl-ACP methyl ester carboxylesterase
MLHEVLNRAASHFDEVVTSTLFHRRNRSPMDLRAETLKHRERIEILARLAELYDRPEHFDAALSFFPAADAISPELCRVRRIAGIAGGEVLDATWSSGFSPHCAEVADRYLEHGPNRVAAARLFVHHGPPRPVVFLIHGYRCGQYTLEERVWPVDWLFKGGFDVALPVLPFHAVRAQPGPALFPSSDLRITVEAFRQAVRDLGALGQFFRERGAPAVGVMGMSLGGYTSALLATLDARLSFAIPIIPLASLGAAARQNGRFVGSEAEQQLQFQAVERVYRVVSPLSRPSRVDKDRVLVIAAAGDRITPIEHARLLAEHFQAPLSVFPGGHVLQFGRAQGFRAAGEMLRRIGLLGKGR